MYLDVSGRLLPGATPAPRRHAGSISSSCPCAAARQPFEVGPAGVYSPACKKRVHCAGSHSCPGKGWEMRGFPHHSRACLFANQSSPFSSYYSMSPKDCTTPIPGVGPIFLLYPALPLAPSLLAHPPCPGALGFQMQAPRGCLAGPMRFQL